MRHRRLVEDRRCPASCAQRDGHTHAVGLRKKRSCAARPACSNGTCSMRLFALARAAGHVRGGLHWLKRMRMTWLPRLPAERDDHDLAERVNCRAQRGKWCAQWGKSRGQNSRLCAPFPRGQCCPGQFGHGGSHGDALQPSIDRRHAELGCLKKPQLDWPFFSIEAHFSAEP